MWDPFTSSSESSVRIFGVELKANDRVRLWPQRRADIFDIAMIGKTAVVQSIERTLEGEVYLCVTLEDDPGADLGAERLIGHRFFFRADEVEPLQLASNGAKP